MAWEEAQAAEDASAETALAAQAASEEENVHRESREVLTHSATADGAAAEATGAQDVVSEATAQAGAPSIDRHMHAPPDTGWPTDESHDDDVAKEGVDAEGGCASSVASGGNGTSCEGDVAASAVSSPTDQGEGREHFTSSFRFIGF